MSNTKTFFETTFPLSVAQPAASARQVGRAGTVSQSVGFTQHNTTTNPAATSVFFYTRQVSKERERKGYGQKSQTKI